MDSNIIGTIAEIGAVVGALAYVARKTSGRNGYATKESVEAIAKLMDERLRGHERLLGERIRRLEDAIDRRNAGVDTGRLRRDPL